MQRAMMTNRLGTRTSRARAAAGLVILAAGLVLSSGNALAAVGDITEYAIPTASSDPSGIAAGPDGNLWFTENGTNKVAKVTTAGVFTEYPIPTADSAPLGIAAGPDGNLWFTENLGNKVAKVTTAGTFTEYLIPTFFSSAAGIAAGPDGNLWFTEAQGNQVAKVTTTGTFTEYPLPTANGAPMGIGAGPDGNLWFTENGGNKVAKVTTAGTFTEYPIPTTTSAPSGIAAGPDGNLWFTENGGNKVAKVTTAGAFTEYPIPTTNSAPMGIAAGPDGNLWFTEDGGNKVAKVTTAGAFTEYPVPTANSAPMGIAAGPDGNLWFTEALGNQVAKVSAGGGTGGGADLAVSMSGSPDPVLVGGQLTYTLTVTDNGPSEATGVSLTVSLSSTVAFGSAATTQGSCTESSGVVTCNLGSLASGASAQITIVVTPTQPGTILSIAQVSGNESDPNPSNNSAATSTTVTPAVDLSITKTDSPDPVVAHQQLTYMIGVSNLAPSVDATGVMVMDFLPAHVMFGSATPSQGTCMTSKTRGATTVTCNLGIIADGGSATITIVVKPLQTGTITNTTSASSSVTDRDLTNNTAQQITTVLR